MTAATSRKYAGEYVFRVHPNLRGTTELKFSTNDASKVIASSDVVFAALPHGESVKIVPQIADAGLKVIDLERRLPAQRQGPVSEMVRLRPSQAGPPREVRFSIPEINRDQVKGARLVSSPGCMAITAILALAPLLKEKILGIDRDHIVVDAKVGSSGAGGKPSLSTHFSERFDVVRPYKPAGHRHSAEVEQVLAAMAGEQVKVSMSAHAVNMVRGILITSHLFTSNAIKPLDVWKAYRSMYTGSYFIRLVRDKQGPFRLPDPKLVDRV